MTQLSHLRHARKAEEIHHCKLSGDFAASSRKRKSSMRLVRHERVTVELEKTDYHLANYPGADRTEAEAIFHYLGFFKDVIPKWGGLVQVKAKIP